MKKTEIFIFIIFILIIFLIARNDYYKEAKNKKAISSDVAMCGYMEDVVEKYDDLAVCNTMEQETIDAYDAEINMHFEKDPTATRRFLSLKECCYAYNNSLPLSRDVYDVFFTILSGPILYFQPILIPFLILFFSLFNINRKFKSKYAHYYLQRKSYKSFMIKSLVSVYKYALGIPFLYLVVYLLTLNITSHQPIDMTLSLAAVKEYFQYVNVNGFWILYGLTGLLFGAFIINIGMIFLHSNGKLIFTIIESFIAYFFISFIDEACFNNILLNYNQVNSSTSIYIAFLSIFIYFIFSFFVMLFVYRSEQNTLYNLRGDK